MVVVLAFALVVVAIIAGQAICVAVPLSVLEMLVIVVVVRTAFVVVIVAIILGLDEELTIHEAS